MSTPPEGAASFLRRGLLALAALATAGIAVELAVARHWTQPIQVVAWGAVAALAVAIALVGWAPAGPRVRGARMLATAVLLSAAVGVGTHVYANYDAAPLDRRYANTWETLPELTRWGLALTKTVGPPPPFAPGALAEAALAVLLATWQHPALNRKRPRPDQAPDARLT